MANEEQLKALYKKVMGGNAELDLFTANEKFMLRVWDGMDGCWTDCFDADVDAGTALAKWAENTENGTKRVSFNEIDYYRIFPGDTRMIWSGSEGREMFR
jgi:hypothetical protein